MTDVKEIKDAADECVKALLIADRHEQYEKRLQAVETEFAPLMSDEAHVVIGATVTKIKSDLANMKASVFPTKTENVEPSAYTVALNLLDEIPANCVAAKRDKELFANFTANLSTAKGHGLLTADPKVGTEVTAINVLITRAETEAGPPDRQLETALQTLVEAALDIKSTKLKKKMLDSAGTVTSADIQDLIDAPGGISKLDTLIAGLADTTDRTLINLALKVRFNLTDVKTIAQGAANTPDVEDAAASGSLNMKKVYSLMTAVPESHVKGNPKFANIKFYKGNPSAGKAAEKGSFYQGSESLVVLSCGRPTDAYETTLGDPAELPAGALLFLHEPNVKPKYFDWTTHHEVAHAVDEKMNFMKQKIGDGAYGNWQEHGGDVRPAADAAATEFLGGDKRDQDVLYLAKLLSDEKPNPVPPAPSPKPPQWDANFVTAQQWCAAVREANDPWDTPAQAVGGRLFHEAYTNDWVSYDAAALNTGVTGYQFRAPGEWFSELYAAYELDKLKSTHPAATWLGEILQKTAPA